MFEQIVAVQKMQDYIKENYLQEITLGDLSKISCYSPCYSHRLFRQYVGHAHEHGFALRRAGVIPEGFDVITLPECEYLMFQGEPFDQEDYGEAIVHQAMEKYDPSAIGYEWDDENGPRIQLEPRGERVMCLLIY